jgi:hypothetical protein
VGTLVGVSFVPEELGRLLEEPGRGTKDVACGVVPEALLACCNEVGGIGDCWSALEPGLAMVCRIVRCGVRGEAGG